MDKKLESLKPALDNVRLFVELSQDDRNYLMNEMAKIVTVNIKDSSKKTDGNFIMKVVTMVVWNARLAKMDLDGWDMNRRD